MIQLTLKLPWPPSLNTYWRSPNKGPLAGRTLISEKGRAYREAVLWGLTTEKLPADSLLTARLSVALYAYPPDKRRRDLDNLPKAILDALTHAGVWADDEQIDQLSIQRCEQRKGGHIRVVITALEAPHAGRGQTNVLGAAVGADRADIGLDIRQKG
jgi:crossover junction endodeoxyribonuclease RusA